jgi:hypothetical protein
LANVGGTGTSGEHFIPEKYCFLARQKFSDIYVQIRKIRHENGIPETGFLSIAIVKENAEMVNYTVLPTTIFTPLHLASFLKQLSA